ncbi:MAG: DUF3833 family protein [Hyphomicrobium sp.]|nr:DUF3833 family protein [Hyphomicrobium sp.]
MDTQATEPLSDTEFDFLAFLDGRVRAWGIFEDRFGTLKRRFSVDLEGQWEGDALSVVEVLRYEDGEIEHRNWRLERSGRGTFRGTSPDVVGMARGFAAERRARMNYKLKLKVGEGRHIVVDLDDRFYAIAGGRVLNRARVSKWGIHIGDVAIVFERSAAPGTERYAA